MSAKTLEGIFQAELAVACGSLSALQWQRVENDLGIGTPDIWFSSQQEPHYGWIELKAINGDFASKAKNLLPHYTVSQQMFMDKAGRNNGLSTYVLIKVSLPDNTYRVFLFSEDGARLAAQRPLSDWGRSAEFIWGDGSLNRMLITRFLINPKDLVDV